MDLPSDEDHLYRESLPKVGGYNEQYVVTNMQ